MKSADLDKTMVKYIALRTERLALDKKSSALKAEEDMLRGIVLREMMGRPNPLYISTGSKYQAELKMRAFADVEDWPTLFTHIQATGEFDLLQKRVTITSVRQRWEAGKTVPGVVQSQEAEVTITKIKEPA